jgi:hypothetical protein
LSFSLLVISAKSACIIYDVRRQHQFYLRKKHTDRQRLLNITIQAKKRRDLVLVHTSAPPHAY